MAAQELIYTPLFTKSSLKGYWRMESDWVDSSPSGYTLTATGSPTFTAGKFGNAGVFNGSSQYSSITNAAGPNLEITGSQTWLGWLYRADSTTDHAICGKTKNDGTILRRIYVNASNGLDFRCDGLTTNTTVSSSITVAATTLTFFAAIYDSANTKLKIWINDTKTEVTASGTMTSSTGDWALGQEGGFGNKFPGRLDDVAVFNEALTDLEIQNYYNGTFNLGILPDII